MRILFAWEMGNNSGHAAKIAALARPFIARGASVWVALKKPEIASNFLDLKIINLLQAPYHPVPQGGRPSEPLTYAEGLIPCGYGSSALLYPLIQCWRSLYESIKPDALITQAAPTALLAARDNNFKKYAFGAGFDIPPLTTPMMPVQYWRKNNPQAIGEREGTIINTINQALRQADLKPIKTFEEILRTDREFLCALPEMDHYKDRPRAQYFGPIHHELNHYRLAPVGSGAAGSRFNAALNVTCSP